MIAHSTRLRKDGRQIGLGASRHALEEHRKSDRLREETSHDTTVVSDADAIVPAQGPDMIDLRTGVPHLVRPGPDDPR
ncbi:hypothetical protein LQ757_14015 [Agromyces sp. SYSU K20354]|uniref:hypothetical protein n=1 Tax=Agromyces cavernae TaxID=2898659 RepID=UPI001E46268F|nr:hypothetical protein [Agromyces cavernae]MCD2443394.1 hypothetical protein [Agromyces cavernae]